MFIIQGVVIMNTINTLYSWGNKYIERAEHSLKLIVIGLVLIGAVILRELAASGFPLSSVVALFGGYLSRHFSYALGLIGYIVGSVLFWLGIYLKASEDKGLMMVGIAMAYNKMQ